MVCSLDFPAKFFLSWIHIRLYLSLGAWTMVGVGGLFLYLAKSYLDEHESPQTNITEIIPALLGECKRLLRSLMTIAENVLWLTWPISALGTGESELCIFSVGV